MNILFMGTPDFASTALKYIFEKYGQNSKISVVTNPDKPQGRNYKMQMPSVKKMALELEIDVFQPENLKKENFAEYLENLSPDIIVVAAYGKILPEYVLNYPKYGCINIHASLLPRYRGAAPINRAIMDGCKSTGVTIMKMEKGLDTGDMLLWQEIEIEKEETAGELHDRLAVIGGELVCKAIDNIVNGKITAVSQDDSLATYAAKIDADVQRIDWSKSAFEVMNHINGLSPFPGAVSCFGGKILKIYRAKMGRENILDVPGKIIEFKKNIEVACAKGSVFLCELQPEGAKRLSSKDIINGRKLELGIILGE